VPPELDVLVERCLVVDPRRRPSAAEVRDALEGNSGTLTRLVADAPTRSLAPARKERRAWLAALAAAILLGGGALGVAASLDGSSGSQKPVPAPRIAPVGTGGTPAQQARNLARWLRRYSR